MKFIKQRILLHTFIRKATNGSSISGRVNNRLYDLESIALMQKLLNANSNCIDIGCHKGEILDKIIEFSPNGNHFGFEPLPNFYKRLVERYKSNGKISILPHALSNEKGETEFTYVKSNPAYSGIRKRKFDRNKEETEKIKVEKAALDDLIDPDLPIHFIKIDVEGGELGVLQGAKKTIEKWQPHIIFEHGLGAADCYGTKPEMLFDFISACDLKISNLDAYLCGKPALEKENFCQQFYNGIHYYFLAHP
ncbi:MAG: FkbM family methyltransferase [Chitinophagales bacterium]